jgi:hypothetical protein
MRSQRWLAGLALLALGVPSWAADPVRELADTIDKHVQAAWEKAKAKPAPVADDAEFLRRVYLQLAGRIPSVSEVREFLDDKKPGKRERVIRKLLDGPRYVTHFVSIWRTWMMPEADASIQARFLIPGFETWLREKLRDNTPYDRLVHELLTTSVDGQRGGVFFYGPGGNQATPSAYYVAKELKPENIGASTARLFLGIRLECAQCHNHPFADWKRDQFWQYAAFFSGIRGQNQGDFISPLGEQPEKRKITIGGSERVVEARFPDGTEPKFQAKEPTRKTLADWVTSSKNPYFARATVNRLWDYFFGMGLIDPVDEMVGVDSSTLHPELLDELAKAFVASKYDLKFIMQAITSSKTYQLSSKHTDPSQKEPKLFARFPLRSMTPEQLYDSVATATGYDEANRNIPGVFFGGPGSPRSDFISRFSEQSGKATEFQTSILQALALMNGKLIETATSLEQSEILLAVADNPFMTMEQRIETLYLAALSRKPTAKELARMLKHLEAQDSTAMKEEDRDKFNRLDFGEKLRTILDKSKTGKEDDQDRKRKRGLSDVFWALLNSAEFVLNH